MRMTTVPPNETAGRKKALLFSRAQKVYEEVQTPDDLYASSGDANLFRFAIA